MLTNTFAAHTHGRIFALSVSTPRTRPNSGAGLASVPAEMHCAAQAEYGRLAAQAYSPSDAMSQARFCLARMKKGSTPPETNLPGNLHAETGRCSGRIWSRGRGGPPDFPRHRRPRCIAPCGGVVWLAQPIAAGCDSRHGPQGSRRRLPAPIPGALDKAAAAAYGVSTAHPAGPAAGPARAPGCGQGSRAA